MINPAHFYRLTAWLGLGVLVLRTGTVPIEAAPALQFEPRERIAFVGNSLGERLGLFGHFEALLHTRFPRQELVIRNFCRPADEVGRQQRPNDYTKIDDPLQVFGADTFFCFFGFNESFAGPAGVEAFKAAYGKFMDTTGRVYAKGEKVPRFVLVSPIAFESPGDPLLPDGRLENENLALYAAAVAEVARERGLAYADLFAPTLPLLNGQTGRQYTINGAHLNEAGEREIGVLLDRALFASPNPAALASPGFARLRAAVVDKSWVHAQDYRMLNGWYVYGGRRTWDTETFPREYKKIRAMTAVRDRYVWDLAQGQTVPSVPDDTTTGELFVPSTRFGVPGQAYSEPKELRYLTGAESLAAITTAEGFDLSLFASEETFPELANPVQINFDNRGRLWVACMPTYPQWRPGDPPPNDRLLVFEDTNQDGRADRMKVFFDRLHCPTGFEFWNGGVLVVSQPHILFLKDTDGDDRADEVVQWTDGWATDDTHHSIGAWEWSPGGLLHMLEGVAVSTAVETPWGPFRNLNTPGAYLVDPRTLRVRHFITPGYGNPWCYVFDDWGQGIVGDGTTAQQHWDTPLSGAQQGPRRGLNTVFDNQGMRPCIGSEFLYSRHFPDEVQGQFVYACVINMNGLPRFEIRDDGAGFAGQRIADLVRSTDRNFRPADPQIGPDGALWFADWHNPLIGHMQYSQRDPNRDKAHGRVYRLTARNRPLLPPATQHGLPIPALLEQLKAYEPRTRYRARRELRDRPAAEVLPALRLWLGQLEAGDPLLDKHRTEALWVQQGHHAVDRAFLGAMLRAPTPQARAAAVHVVADEWFSLSPSAAQPGAPSAAALGAWRPEGPTLNLADEASLIALLRPLTTDDHPRVRLEAVRALSFLRSPDAAEAALDAARKPVDYWMNYTLRHTLEALLPLWKPAFAAGTFVTNNPAGRDFAALLAADRPELEAAQKHFAAVKRITEASAEERAQRLAAVAAIPGRAEAGREIFNRICTACHRADDKGQDYGPDLTQVATRLPRQEIIESIIDPNAKVDPKFAATNITTQDGEEYSGLVAAEDDTTLTLVLGAGTKQVLAKADLASRTTLTVSSMPEGLAEALATDEFLDLIEFLAARK